MIGCHNPDLAWKLIVTSDFSNATEDETNHTFSGKSESTWPNGAFYCGNYVNNVREGKGIQKWSNGYYYEGDFVQNMRHGSGKHVWENGESYEGDFFKDFRHGIGQYNWPDGSSYFGSFYLNKREGFGVHTYANGNVFQGLYKEGNRYGPGVLKYNDGLEDGGLWLNECLIRLNFVVANYFSLKDLSYIGYDLNEGSKTSELSVPLLPHYSKHNNWLNTIKSCSNPDIRSIVLDHKTLTEEFFKKCNLEENQNRDFIVQNLTPQLTAIQAYTQRFRNSLQALDFKFENSHAKDKGILECNSERFIQSAMSGNFENVVQLWHNKLVDINVADNLGITSVIAASINHHIGIINFLLDNGANVNQMTDENLSALGACLVKFYSSNFIGQTKDQCVGNQELGNDNDLKTSGDISGVGDTKTLSQIAEDNAVSDFYVMKPKPRLTNLNQVQSCHILPFSSRNSYLKVKPVHSINDYNSQDTSDILELSASGNSLYNQYIMNTKKLMGKYINILQKKNCIPCEWWELPVLGLEEKRQKRQEIIIKYHGLIATVLTLLSRGADPNASIQPSIALFLPIQAGDVCLLKILLDYGADISCTLKTKERQIMPLHQACLVNTEMSAKVIKILLKAGANPNDSIQYSNNATEDLQKNDPEKNRTVNLLSGESPLYLVCSKKENPKMILKMASLLLKFGADPNIMYQDQTPLSLAVANEHIELIKLLVEANADVNHELPSSYQNILSLALKVSDDNHWNLQKRLYLLHLLSTDSMDLLKCFKFGNGKNGSVVDFAYILYQLDEPNKTEGRLFAIRTKVVQYLVHKITSQAKLHLRAKSKTTEDLDVQKIDQDDSHKFLKFCLCCGHSSTAVLKPSNKYENAYYCHELCCQEAWDDVRREGKTRRKKCRVIVPSRSKKTSSLHQIKEELAPLQNRISLQHHKRIVKTEVKYGRLYVLANITDDSTGENKHNLGHLQLNKKKDKIKFEHHLGHRSITHLPKWDPYLENYSFE